MKYYLMNQNIQTLIFDFDEYTIQVIDNDKLPYMLRDYITNTDHADLKSTISYFSTLKDFFSSRLLNLSRSGAKEILNVTEFSQSNKTEERVTIALACRGMSMTDNFWVRTLDENVGYDELCLRKHPLSEKSYEVAILQHHISATREELRPDLCLGGMFPKFWKRGESGIPELWKTDRGKDFIFTKSELQVSEILDHSNIEHISYRAEEADGLLFAVSDCFVDDEKYFVSASDLIDYRNHTADTMATDSKKWLSLLGGNKFANMVCVDYILANTDRHIENYGFMVESKSNDLIGLAPLYDHNQCLITDDIENRPYEPVGLLMKEAVREFAPKSDIYIENAVEVLPKTAYERYNLVQELQKRCIGR